MTPVIAQANDGIKTCTAASQKIRKRCGNAEFLPDFQANPGSECLHSHPGQAQPRTFLIFAGGQWRTLQHRLSAEQANTPAPS